MLAIGKKRHGILRLNNFVRWKDVPFMLGMDSGGVIVEIYSCTCNANSYISGYRCTEKILFRPFHIHLLRKKEYMIDDPMGHWFFKRRFREYVKTIPKDIQKVDAIMISSWMGQVLTYWNVYLVNNNR